MANPLQKINLQELENAEQIPKNLVIRNGRLETIDGEVPTFDQLDGTYVNLVTHSELKTIAGKILAMRAMAKKFNGNTKTNFPKPRRSGR